MQQDLTIFTVSNNVQIKIYCQNIFYIMNTRVSHHKWVFENTEGKGITTCKEPLSLEPSISFTINWRSSGLPKVKHFSTTLEAYFCWLILTSCPVSLPIIVDRSCGFPCSRTCCQMEIFRVNSFDKLTRQERTEADCGWFIHSNMFVKESYSTWTT